MCFSCASRAFEPIAAAPCPVCSQFLEPDGRCPNWLCSDPARRIERIDAIAYLSGPLRRKIVAYKYEGRHGWATIFARVLLGWLDTHLRDRPPDLIVANPTWLDTGDDDALGHTERVLQAAAREDLLGSWPFDLDTPRAVVKNSSTARSARNTATAKRRAARELRAALAVPDPGRVAGKRILIYDDVCTTGTQLNAVADALLTAGAAEVFAVVLARTPWRPRPPP